MDGGDEGITLQNAALKSPLPWLKFLSTLRHTVRNRANLMFIWVIRKQVV